MLKPTVFILMILLICPFVTAYRYVITAQTPANNSFAPFSGQSCQPVTVSYSVALEVDTWNPLDWSAWMFGKDINSGVLLIRYVPLDPYGSYIWSSIQHITTKQEIRNNFLIPNVCYNEVWGWQPVISEDNSMSVHTAGKEYILKGMVVNVTYPPPSATNLRNCLSPSGTNCYGSGASFAYSTQMVYPAFNLTSNAARVTVTLYSSSDVRGVLPTSQRTTDMGGPSKIYITSGIPVQPGETITWYVELDDGVHTPTVKTSPVTFSINNAPNVPPKINITYPANGQRFPYGHSITTINATVTDDDTSQNSVTVQFLVNDVVQCTRNQVSQYYSCEVPTINAGTYKVTVTAVDNVANNKRNQTIYFTIDRPETGNHLPEYNLLPYQNKVARNGTLKFTLNASDRDGDPLWFDIYCQYYAVNNTSLYAQDDSPYASTGWVGPFYVKQGESYQYTFTCPDKTKNPSQWSKPGRYIVSACVTDGSESDGKGGFGLSNYHACAYAEIQVMDAQTIVTFDENETIQFNTCLITSEDCSLGILNEFYYGIIGFFRGFFIYFVYLFIVFLVALTAYYIYLKVREGFI